MLYLKQLSDEIIDTIIYFVTRISHVWLRFDTLAQKRIVLRHGQQVYGKSTKILLQTTIEIMKVIRLKVLLKSKYSCVQNLQHYDKFELTDS